MVALPTHLTLVITALIKAPYDPERHDFADIVNCLQRTIHQRFKHLNYPVSIYLLCRFFLRVHFAYPGSCSIFVLVGVPIFNAPRRRCELVSALDTYGIYLIIYLDHSFALLLCWPLHTVRH